MENSEMYDLPDIGDVVNVGSTGYGARTRSEEGQK